MPEIRQLSTSVINKIAAGEVIERPASVVKELVENSVDAGAQRIDVSIENGGNDLIRVADDGCGIALDQLTLAFASHATSKITDADDLFRVATMGFRGEALASIAEVSKATLRSRPKNATIGYELTVNGGVPEPIVPCGTSPGTTLEVRNLFFNTPVRRRFLKSPSTEMGHIGEAFTRIALAHPSIHFTLSHGNRVAHDLVPTENWAERIGHFFGPEIRQALIPVHASDGQVSVHGFVCDPSQNRSHNRMQYLFLNGRHIKDRSLQHALGEAYRGLIMTGRFPIAFLRLEIPVDQVDVNVHPAKLEVRFQDGGRIYSHLLAAIRNRFLATDLTARAQLERPKPTDPHATAESITGATARPSSDPLSLPHDSLTPAGEATDLSKTTTSYRAPALPFPVERAAPLPPFLATRSQPAAIDVSRFDGPLPSPNTTPRHALDDLPPLPPQPERHTRPSKAITNSELYPPASDRRPTHAVQIQRRYIVTECEDGMLVIDQHALHERILYEQIRERIVNGALETQTLLVPLPVALAPAESAAALECQETLAKIGLMIEPFGGDSVLLRSYPAMLASEPPEAVLRMALESLLSGGRKVDRRDLLDALMHMMSCKAAVRAGDPLTADEIDALVEHRHWCQDSHHCPHGRPTALVFSREELDRRFKRI